MKKIILAVATVIASTSFALEINIEKRPANHHVIRVDELRMGGDKFNFDMFSNGDELGQIECQSSPQNTIGEVYLSGFIGLKKARFKVTELCQEMATSILAATAQGLLVGIVVDTDINKQTVLAVEYYQDK